MPAMNPALARFAVSEKSRAEARKPREKQQLPMLKLGSGEQVVTPPAKEEARPVSLMVVIIGLFAVASLFQTLAWYYNVDGQYAFWTGFMISMGFVVVEYLCMLPANQLGYKIFNLVQLGMLVEIVNWIVFILYVKYVRKEEVTGRSWVGLGVMVIAIVIMYT